MSEAFARWPQMDDLQAAIRDLQGLTNLLDLSRQWHPVRGEFDELIQNACDRAQQRVKDLLNDYLRADAA